MGLFLGIAIGYNLNADSSNTLSHQSFNVEYSGEFQTNKLTGIISDSTCRQEFVKKYEEKPISCFIEGWSYDELKYYNGDSFESFSDQDKISGITLKCYCET